MSLCHLCKSKARSLYKVNYYHYFFCSNCNVLFLHPIPKEKEIKTYYRENFEYTAGLAGEKKIRTRSLKIIRRLKQLLPQGKTLLDVGSGYGYFLDEAKKHYREVIGIEPSRNLHSASINRFIDINIVYSSFENYYKKNQKVKFDFITFIHVIEHLPDPKKTLRQIISLLKPNGILYIETPNIDSHLYHAEKENYTFLTPPNHIWLFSSHSFQQMLKNFKNIRMEKLSTYSYPEHFMGIIKKFVPRHPKGDQNTNLNIQILNDQKQTLSISSKFKYFFFDKLLAPLFTPLLNIGGYGSILELYIKKIK